ncbi:MAG: HD family phosphohydrolase, partial [Deltaproteobacteria bacterium]|nr:HD family phosphohydrolase [Deltaproteobacteria bacterium]
NLPTAIIDFITQHHGTGLIDYFYEKALREAEESEEVDDALYRYPGPKPQTKEAGILMLADQVEATSRVLSDPTPARIQGMVQKIVNKVFAAGQLDECEMTLRELHQIARAFTRVLSAIFHKRIEYSEPAEKGRESREKEEDGKRGEEKATDKESRDRHNRQTSSGGEASFGFSEEGDEPESAEALRRLGIEPH